MLWLQWRRPDVVHILPDRLYAVRPYKFNRLATITSRAWSSTRVGPRSDPFPVVCRRSSAADKTPPAGSSHIHRRHLDLQLLSTMWRRRPLRQNVCLCRQGVVVDEGQLTVGKSLKDWGPLVLVRSSSAPDSAYPPRRHGPVRWCTTSLLTPRPRHLHRLGRHHAVARNRHRGILLHSASKQDCMMAVRCDHMVTSESVGPNCSDYLWS